MTIAIKTANFLNNKEGRDKVCKFIQYFSRFMMHVVRQKNASISSKFESLYENMKDARKLFRLLKWVNEYQKIADYLELTDPSWDNIDQALNILSRISYALFWFIENIFILSKLKLIHRDREIFRIPLNTFHFLGLFLLLVFAIRQIFRLINLQKTITKFGVLTEEQVTRIDNTKANIRKYIRVVLRVLCDMITVGSACRLWQKFGINFNDMHKGFGGSCASLLSCWDLYK